MYKDILIRSGLTEDEALAYECLLLKGPLSAAELVAKVKQIKRPLMYKVLERLSKRGLVEEKKAEGRTVFIPQSPEILAKVAEDQEAQARKAKEHIHAALPEMKAKFLLSTERPTLRFFEGTEGLREMLEDKVASGAKELRFIRTSRAESYRETFGGTWFGNYLKRQTAAGITAYALTVDDEFTNHDPDVDAARKVVRTWIRPQDYTSPVQIDVYADRVSILSLGKELFGIIIENAPLAQAMKEIFALAERGAKTLPITHDHPPVKDVKRRRKELESAKQAK